MPISKQNSETRPAYQKPLCRNNKNSLTESCQLHPNHVFCRAVVHHHQQQTPSKREHRNGEANVPLLQAERDGDEAEPSGDAQPNQDWRAPVRESPASRRSFRLFVLTVRFGIACCQTCVQTVASKSSYAKFCVKKMSRFRESVFFFFGANENGTEVTAPISKVRKPNTNKKGWEIADGTNTLGVKGKTGPRTRELLFPSRRQGRLSTVWKDRQEKGRRERSESLKKSFEKKWIELMNRLESDGLFGFCSLTSKYLGMISYPPTPSPRRETVL